MPLAAWSRNKIQSRKSARCASVRVTARFRLARYIAALSRPRKWRAFGMINPAWFSRPIKDSRSGNKTVMLFNISLIDRVHAMCLWAGRAIVRCLVSINHP
eukprot:scaffold55618_cov46-Attheya_sp.AAC.1